MTQLYCHLLLFYWTMCKNNNNSYLKYHFLVRLIMIQKFMSELVNRSSQYKKLPKHTYENEYHEGYFNLTLNSFTGTETYNDFMWHTYILHCEKQTDVLYSEKDSWTTRLTYRLQKLRIIWQVAKILLFSYKSISHSFLTKDLPVVTYS
jgi:hypothetical protein